MDIWTLSMAIEGPECPVLFSILAAYRQPKLWRTRHRCADRREMQNFIAPDKAHCR